MFARGRRWAGDQRCAVGAPWFVRRGTRLSLTIIGSCLMFAASGTPRKSPGDIMRTLAIVAGALVAIGASAASAGQLTVTSYDMNNGCGNSCGGTYNYWDGNYNGTGSANVSNAPLSGGTGALTDGVIATDAWYNVSNELGTGQYVGWQTGYYGNPLITFHLAGAPRVSSVNLYVDNSNVGGVGAPSSITIDGTTYAPTVTSISAYAEELTVSGLSLTGSTITVQPNVGSEPWIFVSEAQFFSTVPETSTWAMLLLGFAGLGFAGYRRAKAGRTALAA